MSDELKPCPFCGEPLRVYQINNLPNAVWCVECTGENCYWENEVGGDTRAEAEAVANAPRPVEDALCAENATMREFVEAFVSDGYSEWTGAEYRCPHCGSGKRMNMVDPSFLWHENAHAKNCAWRRAAEWLAAKQLQEVDK